MNTEFSPSQQFSFSWKGKVNSELCLDILLAADPDGMVQRNVDHRANWGGRYIKFSSFAPVASKQDQFELYPTECGKYASTIEYKKKSS